MGDEEQGAPVQEVHPSESHSKGEINTDTYFGEHAPDDPADTGAERHGHARLDGEGKGFIRDVGEGSPRQKVDE